MRERHTKGMESSITQREESTGTRRVAVVELKKAKLQQVFLLK
jgi:hypothetical protein